MKKVIVGSNNPVKLAVTKQAFEHAWPSEEFEFSACGAESGVADQPFGLEETKRGAKNRAKACRDEYPEGDFFVGLEGGIEIISDEYWVNAWMCVLDSNENYSYGRTGSFLLPPQVKELVEQGEELGTATDIVFNEKNSKQKGGAIGALTNGSINRQDFYLEAMTFALIPFLKADLYKIKN